MMDSLCSTYVLKEFSLIRFLDIYRYSQCKHDKRKLPAIAHLQQTFWRTPKTQQQQQRQHQNNRNEL